MFKKLKMRLAARKMENKKHRTDKDKKTRATKNKNAKTNVILSKYLYTPFRNIGNWFKKIWLWIRSLDLIGLINLTLLSAIIVLFSMLIIDITRQNEKPIVIIARNDITNIKTEHSQTINSPKPVQKQAKPVLPLKRDIETRKFIDTPINVVQTEKCTVTEPQTAKINNTIHGDVIIDSRGAATILKAGDTIKGNLYLQNMQKYTLPCNINIEGNLFLRDMGMLQFCGDFTVKGNIYVSPRSSFGPLPKTARLGGQVIL